MTERQHGVDPAWVHCPLCGAFAAEMPTAVESGLARPFACVEPDCSTGIFFVGIRSEDNGVVSRACRDIRRMAAEFAWSMSPLKYALDVLRGKTPDKDPEIARMTAQVEEHVAETHARNASASPDDPDPRDVYRGEVG